MCQHLRTSDILFRGHRRIPFSFLCLMAVWLYCFPGCLDLFLWGRMNWNRMAINNGMTPFIVTGAYISVSGALYKTLLLDWELFSTDRSCLDCSRVCFLAMREASLITCPLLFFGHPNSIWLVTIWRFALCFLIQMPALKETFSIADVTPKRMLLALKLYKNTLTRDSG